jgi:hypothetical protein
MYLGVGGAGRLAAEMRVRVAVLVALAGIAAIPGVSDAIQPIGQPSLKVSVKPRSGSRATHFVISFKAAVTTSRVGPIRDRYRITASVKRRGKCQATTSMVAPPSRAGATVHVTLAPSRARGWCTGTFRGQVWNELVEPCPEGKACPAIVPLPRIVGTFSFHVRRG